MENLKVKFNFRKLRKQTHESDDKDNDKTKPEDKSGAERSRRFWKKWKNSDGVREKNKIKCTEYRQKTKQTTTL